MQLVYQEVGNQWECLVSQKARAMSIYQKITVITKEDDVNLFTADVWFDYFMAFKTITTTTYYILHNNLGSVMLPEVITLWALFNAPFDLRAIKLSFFADDIMYHEIYLLLRISSGTSHTEDFTYILKNYTHWVANK